MWEVVSGRERDRFTGHAGFAMGLAYSPDGTLLVTGGTDRTALVWDVSGLRTADQKKADFTREDVDRFWADLADADAGKAFGAMKVLRANSTPAVSLLKERLRPVAASDPKKIARLIADLDQEDFTARESATKQLSELGELAEPALRAALNDTPSGEKRRRIDDLLKRLDPSNFPEVLRGVRARRGAGKPRHARGAAGVANLGPRCCRGPPNARGQGGPGAPEEVAKFTARRRSWDNRRTSVFGRRAARPGPATRR